MQLTQHNAAGLNVIRRYGADFVVIGDEEIRRSCLVSAHLLTRDWLPRRVEEITLEVVAPIFELTPEIVVLSTGATQRFPRAALRAEFASRRIGLEVMEVGAACRTYNVLVAEERKVVAAILMP